MLDPTKLCIILLAMLIAGTWLHSRVVYYTRTTHSLRSIQTQLHLCVALWGMVILYKVVDIHCNGPLSDAFIHETRGRLVAALIADGRWADVFASFGIGNTGYQFLLGIFYAITSAPPEVTVIINSVFACMGVLGLLDALARNTMCQRVPAWLAVCICALPSTLFWTTAHLKEGVMLWAICGVIRGGLLLGDKTVPYEKGHFFASAMAGLWFRPHIMAAWLVAVGVGGVVLRKKYHLLPFIGGGLLVAFLGFSIFLPDVMRGFSEEGITDTLASRYQEQTDAYTKIAARGDHGGGSTVRYSSGKPVPFLSGLALIFLRPYPTEVFDFRSLSAGTEVWFLSATLFGVWFLRKRRFQLLFTPAGVVGLLGILFIAFHLSYCYNLGLVARQRLQVFPGILLLIALPVLSRSSVSSKSSEEEILKTHFRQFRPTHYPFIKPCLPVRSDGLAKRGQEPVSPVPVRPRSQPIYTRAFPTIQAPPPKD